MAPTRDFIHRRDYYIFLQPRIQWTCKKVNWLWLSPQQLPIIYRVPYLQKHMCGLEPTPHSISPWLFRLQKNGRGTGILFFLTRFLSQTPDIGVGFRDGGHEQMISNGARFKSAFAIRDKKQTTVDLRWIPTNWFKNQLCPSIRFQGLRMYR